MKCKENILHIIYSHGTGWGICNALDFYSGDNRFEPRTNYRIYWL